MGWSWWQWQTYTYLTKVILLFIKYRLHWICPVGKIAEMSRWCNGHQPSFWNRKLKGNFNSMSEKILLWKYIFNCTDCFIYLEFGVYEGNSFRWWCDRVGGVKLYGFDSFEGLPEKFQNFGHGFLDRGGNVPEIDDDRVCFIKGLYQCTLNNFIDSTPGLSKKRLVVHMDSDVYSSTLYVLMKLERILKAGDIIIFDEFAHPNHEYRAFRDFIRATGIKFRVIGATAVYYHVAIEIG